MRILKFYPCIIKLEGIANNKIKTFDDAEISE